MSYPDKCFRGLSDENSISNEGLITSGAFTFIVNNNRNDEWEEASISWDDAPKSSILLCKQTKEDGSLQFKHGMAVVPRQILDFLAKQHNLSSYERAVLDDNPYHGNILLKKNISKPARRSISATIGAHATWKENPYL